MMGKRANSVLAAGLAAVMCWTSGCTHSTAVTGPIVTNLRVRGNSLEVTECDLRYEDTDDTGAAVVLLILVLPLVVMSGGRGGSFGGGGGGKKWSVEAEACSTHWVELPSPAQDSADELTASVVPAPAPDPKPDPCVDPISRWLEIREVARSSTDRARRLAAKRALRSSWKKIPAQCRAGLEASQ